MIYWSEEIIFFVEGNDLLVGENDALRPKLSFPNYLIQHFLVRKSFVIQSHQLIIFYCFEGI